MKTSFVYIPVVWKKSQRWRFELTDLCSSTILSLKKGILQQIGEGLLLMMGLVVSSTIDLDAVIWGK